MGHRNEGEGRSYVRGAPQTAVDEGDSSEGGEGVGLGGEGVGWDEGMGGVGPGEGPGGEGVRLGGEGSG
jgi:hypothetical protein